MEGGMKGIGREYLADQLKELSNWADYLHQSLTLDRPFERGKLKLLESLVPEDDLAQLRFDLRSVQYRLANLSVNLSTSSNLRGIPPAPSGTPAPGALASELGRPGAAP
jgi:hypothetical protein